MTLATTVVDQNTIRRRGTGLRSDESGICGNTARLRKSGRLKPLK